MTGLAPALIAAVAAWGLTGLVRRFAQSRAIVDIPNERSSHVTPTPRGGGLAIAVVIFAGIGWLAWRGEIPGPLAAALLGGGLLVAAVGWADDRRSQPARVRIIVHFLAAGWAVWWLGRLPLAEQPAGISGGGLGLAFEVLAIAWAINLYNFMDGIDGLACGQALVAGSLGGILLSWGGHPGLAGVSATVAGASAGFLIWNWSPARIFLGDVGSGLLGFLFATVAIASGRAGALSLAGWGLLFGVFVFDATVTLVRRMLRRERWYAAHRSHAYQRAVQAGWTHQRVSATAMGLAGGLGGLAWIVDQRPGLTLPILAATAVMLAIPYLWLERRHPM